MTCTLFSLFIGVILVVSACEEAPKPRQTTDQAKPELSIRFALMSNKYYDAGCDNYSLTRHFANQHVTVV